MLKKLLDPLNSLNNIDISGCYLKNKNKITDINIKSLKERDLKNRNEKKNNIDNIKMGGLKSYKKITKKQIINILKNNNIKGYSRLNKKELLFMYDNFKKGKLKSMKKIIELNPQEKHEYFKLYMRKYRQRKRKEEKLKLKKEKLKEEKNKLKKYKHEEKIKKEIKIKEKIEKLKKEKKIKIKKYKKKYIEKKTEKITYENLINQKASVKNLLKYMENKNIKLYILYLLNKGEKIEIFNMVESDYYNQTQTVNEIIEMSGPDIRLYKILRYLYNNKDENKHIILKFYYYKRTNDINIKEEEEEEIRYLTLNYNLVENLEKRIHTHTSIINSSNAISDAFNVIGFIYIKKIIAYMIEKKKKYVKKSGEMFKYVHRVIGMAWSWERYGLYLYVSPENYKDNCLIQALRNSKKIDRINLNLVQLLCKSRSIPMCELNKVCDYIGYRIHLKYMRINKNKQHKTNIIKYGKKGEIINLGLIDGHYFIIDKETNITKYALENYYKIKHIKNYNFIYNSKHKKDEKRVIDSFKLFEILLNNKDKYLCKINLSNHIYKTIAYKEFNINDNYRLKYDKIENLKYNKKDIKGIYKKSIEELNKEISSLKESIDIDSIESIKTNDKLIKKYEKHLKKREIHMNKIFFDIESNIYEKYHEPYLCSAVLYNELNNKKEVMTFRTKYCVRNFLNEIDRDSLIIIHNASYDFRMMISEFFNIKLIKQGSRIKQVTCKYMNDFNEKKYNIIIKDSYCLIPMKLENFGKCFNLENKKQIMPYPIYNTKNLKKKTIKIKKALKYINKEDRKEFIKNIDDWGLRRNIDEFEHIEYSKIYCEYDCLTLFEGYMKFRKWILESINIDIDYFISIPSVSHKYLINEDVYLDCYQLSGVPREYIQQCIRGGRVMTRLNKKYHIKKKIQDFDAVSLYPSAMERIGKIGGFLKGDPRVITGSGRDGKGEIEFEEIKKYDGFFIRIKIKSIGKRYKFPLLNYKNKDGILKYTDDIKEFKNRIIYIDKIGLEDLIRFHKIKFEIIDGYYFNEGRNENILKKIQFLFNERLKKKKEKNPIQEVYKLIMNGCYGRTIMKEIIYLYKIKDNREKLNKYLLNNYNKIIEYEKINNSCKWILKEITPIFKHFSMPHIGCEILSMSKRIMNEVMCLADDLNINIYYQDTDSMHIEDKSIKLLENKYREIYKRELIGKNLGQFHCDFDFKSDIIPIAVESIFLGKKCYLDKIRVINNGKKEYKYHIRMKGVNYESIIDKIEKMSKGKYKLDLMYIYKVLYKGVKISFDLVSKNKVRFNFCRNMGIKTLKSFMREICF